MTVVRHTNAFRRDSQLFHAFRSDLIKFIGPGTGEITSVFRRVRGWFCTHGWK